MPVITLTSDWGLKDHYLAAVKGAIYTQLPSVTVIDISHDVQAFNIEQASFIIKNCFKNFPEGSIHIIGVNTIASIETPHIVASYEGHYFIGSDNGIFSLIFDKEPGEIIELDVIQDSDYFTFSTRDIFVKVACMIAKGKEISSMGNKKESINKKILFHPVIEKNAIKGIVIHIDVYENAITNITESLFKEIVKAKPFTISFRGYEIRKISKSYHDVPQGEILALFGSNSNLEIAMNQGNAASLLGLHFKDTVRIEF